MLPYETYEPNLHLGGANLYSLAHQRLLARTITNGVIHPEHARHPFYQFRYDKF